MPRKSQERAQVSGLKEWRTADCWTDTGLERFPQVERALECLFHRVCRPVDGKKLEGGLNSLLTYFRRGFIPLSTPNKRKRQHGSAVIADQSLLWDKPFRDLCKSQFSAKKSAIFALTTSVHVLKTGLFQRSLS